MTTDLDGPTAQNPRSRHSRLAQAAALAYYHEDKKMEAIARDLDVSRSTVSRLLAFAREAGIVEIRVARPELRATAIERDLHEVYDVDATVVAVPEDTGPEERHARTAAYAAELLHEVVSHDTVLAIAWGTMVNAISYYLKPKAVTNCKLVQLNGIGHSSGVGVHYAHAMMNRYGEAFRANVQQFPAPIFFDSGHLNRLCNAERVFANVRQMGEKADIALFSIGTVSTGVPSSPHLYGSFLTDPDFDQLAQDGAVGDIGTTFFDENGEYRTIRINDRSTGPDLANLKQIARRVGVVSGTHKIEALRAALRGGHIGELIIDEVTAQALLELTTKA